MKVSNERIGEIFGGKPDIVDLFSRIDAYQFDYTPEALRLYEGTKGVDDGTNVGVLAQELSDNPVTENTVSTDENGYEQIDTRKLTAADTAVLSDVCKRLLAIEKKLGMTEGEEDATN